MYNNEEKDKERMFSVSSFDSMQPSSGSYFVHGVRQSLYEPSWEKNYRDSLNFPVRLTIADGAQAFIYHWHDAVEILCGLEGQTVVGVDHPYTLGKSDILLIASGESHCLFPSGREDKRLVLMFDPALIFRQGYFAGDEACFSQIARHSESWSKETAQRVRSALFEIQAAFRDKSPGWRETVTGQLFLLTGALINGAPKRAQSEKPPRDDSLRRILSYLSDHYLEPVTLEACARSLGFNASYLSSMFSSRTGASFHQYLINLRLKKAEWLLTCTDLAISEAAAESGFSSDKTFYRTFRERYGISPGEYRKQHQK